LPCFEYCGAVKPWNGRSALFEHGLFCAQWA
jgi:hypothetical protein